MPDRSTVSSVPSRGGADEIEADVMLVAVPVAVDGRKVAEDAALLSVDAQVVVDGFGDVQPAVGPHHDIDMIARENLAGAGTGDPAQTKDKGDGDPAHNTAPAQNSTWGTWRTASASAGSSSKNSAFSNLN